MLTKRLRIIQKMEIINASISADLSECSIEQGLLVLKPKDMSKVFLLVANIIEVVRLLIKKDTEKAKKKIIRSIWYLIGLIVICSVVFVFLSLLMVS